MLATRLTEFVLARFRRRRREALLAHRDGRAGPSIRLVSLAARVSASRLELAERLLLAWDRASTEESACSLRREHEDLWTRLIAKELSGLLGILEHRDVPALAEFLSRFGERYTWFGGITLAPDAYTAGCTDAEIGRTYLDKLVCLAEAIGVLAVENPEQGSQWARNLRTPVGALCDAVERSIGMPLLPPPGAVYVRGIETPCGVIHYRHLNGLYAALRLRAIGGDGARVCEYGAGLGLAACYARSLGVTDYTLLDLPLVNLFAGHYLLNTLGADAVSLYGEQESATSVKVLPYWKCLDLPASRFSVSLNQDSFPEIDERLVRTYLAEIARTTVGHFLSINQEATAPMTTTRRQSSARILVRESPAFRPISRSRYWMREGYVEELFAVS